MAAPVSAPPATLSRPSPSVCQAQCICEISEITSQLLNKDTIVRFKCLAYSRTGSSLIRERCKNSCENQSRPLLFQRAKQILQGKAPVTFVDYVGIVIRILFCNTHGKSTAFKKYQDLFQPHWKGDESPKELELLKAIRQAYQLPSAHPVQVPSIVEPSSSRSSNPSKTKPETEGSGLNVPLDTSLIPQDTGNARDAASEQGQHEAFAGSFVPRRRLLAPSRPSQRMRTRSNPPQQRKENSPAANESANTPSVTTEDSEPVHAPSRPFGIPSDGSFEFRYPPPNIPLPLRQERNGAPNLNSNESAPKFLSHKSESSLPNLPVPSEQVSDTSDKQISSSPLPNGSEPKAHDQDSFSPADWDICDFFPSFDLSGLRRNAFKPITMPKRSKDDTFIEQVSSSAAKAAPPLFQPPTQDSVPNPRPSNGPDKDFIPQVVDDYIRKTIMKPVTKEGHVYVLRAPKYFEQNYPGEPPRVKIGMAINVERRISDLKAGCGIFDLERVEDHEDASHPWYYKIEELAKSELMNFKRVLRCARCRTSKGESSAHQEWFEVPETVALQAVQRWRKFILTRPYDENGILTDQWSAMARHANIIWKATDEEYSDHERRNERWNRWLEEGIKASERLK